jgi:hypothetical protein
MTYKHFGEWWYSYIIFYLSTRWTWVVSFTLDQLYPRGNSPRYTLYRRLSGPQSQPESCEEQKNFMPLLGTEPQSSISDWATLTGREQIYICERTLFLEGIQVIHPKIDLVFWGRGGEFLRSCLWCKCTYITVFGFYFKMKQQNADLNLKRA